MPRNSPFVGGCGKCAPHPTSLRSATFPPLGEGFTYSTIHRAALLQKNTPGAGLAGRAGGEG